MREVLVSSGTRVVRRRREKPSMTTRKMTWSQPKEELYTEFPEVRLGLISGHGLEPHHWMAISLFLLRT
jgi:hypothetical protein